MGFKYSIRIYQQPCDKWGSYPIFFQYLYSMIMNNVDIKGISYKNAEFKLSQFAADTTIFLDGSQNSLQGALHTIEDFGSYSGLKINTSKTKLIWIGR